MRSRPITPADLTAEQRRIYDDMRPVVEADFPEIKAVRQDGALTGPWTALLQWPQYGSATWELAKALSLSPALPADVREVAILVTGTRFQAAYEIWAHTLVAERRGISEGKVAAITAGQRPADLTADEGAAYDLTVALLAGGGVPDVTYARAVDRFGETATAELIFLVGLYCLVSVTLNGFDIEIPT